MADTLNPLNGAALGDDRFTQPRAMEEVALSPPRTRGGGGELEHAAPYPMPEPRASTGGHAPVAVEGGGGDVLLSVAAPRFSPRLKAPPVVPHLQAAALSIYVSAEELLDGGEWHDDGTFVYYPPRGPDGAQDPARCAIVALQRALRDARTGPTRPGPVHCPPPIAGIAILPRDRWIDRAWAAAQFVGQMILLGLAGFAGLALIAGLRNWGLI